MSSRTNLDPAASKSVCVFRLIWRDDDELKSIKSRAGSNYVNVFIFRVSFDYVHSTPGNLKDSTPYPHPYPLQQGFHEGIEKSRFIVFHVCKLNLGEEIPVNCSCPRLEDGGTSYFASDDMLWKRALLPLNSISTASRLVKAF
ncbi:hypothetical protein CDAR_10111 [Caerostris darwini]|uniref:Uncharacterized protein n=1 Tax=Caerostris darwini TaxID=1538125 RepID=A0AAV4WMS7_9ARAC|nr:hypothetical protein CDAR_10111 [Caerostris darwini]